MFCISDHACENWSGDDKMIPTKYLVAEEGERDSELLTVHHDRLKPLKTISLLVDSTNDAKTLVTKAWTGDGQYFRSYDIETIQGWGLAPLYRKYVRKKLKVLQFARRVALKSPDQYGDGLKPIATAAIVSNLTALANNVDHALNEYYLFCAVGEEKLDDIKEHGFEHSGWTTGFLGKGLYFTDNPAEAYNTKGIFYILDSSRKF